MKLFARPNSFYEAMTSVMYFNYLLGLRVFEYPRGYPRSVFSLIYILIIYIIFCRSAVSMGVYLENIKLLKLDYIIFLVTGNMYVLSVILKMILGWRHSKEITVCHKKIFQIDKTLRELGLEVNYDRMYFMTIGFMTSWFILFIFISRTCYIYFQARSDTLHAIYVIFVSMISVSVDYVNAFEFYAFLRLLHTKFELINHLLRETIRILSEQETKLDTFKLKDYTKLLDFEQQKSIPSIKKISQWRQRFYSASNFVLKKQSSVMFKNKIYIPFYFKKKLQSEFQSQFYENISKIKYKNHTHLLQIIKQVHLELCKVSKLICSAFGVQMAWEIGIVIISIIQTLYNFYNHCIIQLLKATLEDTLMAIILSFIGLLKVFLLCCACKNAADEGNKTVELIHMTQDSNTEDMDTKEEMQQFGIQILQSPVTFYLFGMTMDNHILSMILKNVTTYMVIIVQVGSSLESNNDIKDIHF